MDNRGNNRDSDRDRDNDRGGSNNNRRTNNDRGVDREGASSSSSQNRHNEEDETSQYRSQIAPRSTNITTNRALAPVTNNVTMERFYAYGHGPGVPMKPGGKSAAVVAIQ
jgi:hypothetical protein